MAEITFKKFNQFVSMENDPTDEQITEIFGVFRNNDKLDKLKKTRQELTLAQRADREKKDAMMKAAAMKARGQTPDDEKKPAGSGTARAQNARERGQEYGDWRVAEAKAPTSPLGRQVHDSLDNAKDNESFEKGGDLFGKDASAIAQDLVEFDAALGRYRPEQLRSHVESWMAIHLKDGYPE
jgi:hypothetical protein